MRPAPMAPARRFTKNFCSHSARNSGFSHRQRPCYALVQLLGICFAWLEVFFSQYVAADGLHITNRGNGRNRHGDIHKTHSTSKTEIRSTRQRSNTRWQRHGHMPCTTIRTICHGIAGIAPDSCCELCCAAGKPNNPLLPEKTHGIGRCLRRSNYTAHSPQNTKSSVIFTIRPHR